MKIHGINSAAAFLEESCTLKFSINRKISQLKYGLTVYVANYECFNFKVCFHAFEWFKSLFSLFIKALYLESSTSLLNDTQVLDSLSLVLICLPLSCRGLFLITESVLNLVTGMLNNTLLRIEMTLSIWLKILLKELTWIVWQLRVNILTS